MKKIFFIPLIFILLSCNSIKIKEIGSDSTQELVGKIKKIEMTELNYSVNDKDTIFLEVNSILFFDNKNRITKQIDYYPKFIDETDFNYKKDLLEYTISKIENRINKIVYKYDTKKNIIEYSQFENDTLYFKKSIINDSKNNPIQKKYFYPNNKHLNSIENYTYDYKNRIVKIQSYDENNKSKKSNLKLSFNNKGYIIKTESINTDSNNGNSSSNIKEYDKLGNLIKKFSLDNNGKPKEAAYYKNTYDEKGNIIIREMYWNQKLLEKKIYKITYR